MAGSLADFKYIDDQGKAWLIRIDKSNALITGTGFIAIAQADLSLNYLPRNLEARYVNCRHPTRPINRTLYCRSTSSALWLGTVTTVSLIDYQDKSLQTFNVGKRVAENQKYRPNLIDSYQNDST